MTHGTNIHDMTFPLSNSHRDIRHNHWTNEIWVTLTYIYIDVTLLCHMELISKESYYSIK